MSLSKTVGEYYGIPYKKGDVGIEIEVEGNNKDQPYFPSASTSLPSMWRAEGDGSLRGNAIEYIFKKPCPVEGVSKHLSDLNGVLLDLGVEVDYSFRAGVHVHVNCLNMTFEEVLVFAALYYALEEVLVEWCGKDRIGNHFCLRVRDAQAVTQMAGNIFRTKNFNNFGDDSFRYASLNFSSLPKYGTLEFRALATYPGFDKIDTWAKLLVRLRDLAREKGSINTLLEEFSMAEYTDWLKEYLGDFYLEIAKQKGLKHKSWLGIRNSQELLLHSM